MTIEFPCHNCLQPLRVPDTSAGKGARCPKCQAVTPVPAAGSQGPGVRSQEPLAMRPAAPPVQPVSPPPQSVPAPQPSANDALFAMLKAATTPQPLGPQPLGPQPSVPPAMPSPLSNPGASPFAAALPGPAASLNPYASPAEAYLSQAAVAGASHRPGLPWEIEGPGVVSWWKTSQLCLTDASHAFRLMRQEGGIGSPLLFAGLGLLLGFVGQTIWRLPVMLLEMGGGGNNGWPQGMNGALFEIGLGAVFTLAMATFGLFFFAALYHVCLLALGGARHGFETTYRVVAFTHGSIAWLQVVPCVGGCIVLVMLYICLINGLAAAQETTGGKAAAAVFLPLGLFLLLGALALGGIIAMAIALDA